MENLSVYLNEAIYNLIKSTVKASITNPRELLFLIRYYLKSKKAQQKRKAFERNGVHIPPFLIASITKSCNLFCTGCYARANKSCGENLDGEQLSKQRWGEIFNEAEALGIGFILLAGGEPMLRAEVVYEASLIDGIIFPIFTNGTIIDDTYMDLFNKHRNLIPILSIEGNEIHTDTKRGAGVYKKLISSMISMKKKNILFGSSITVTKKNIDYVTCIEFVSTLKENGCTIVFYVEYVPVDAKTKDLAPSHLERSILEERLLTLKKQFCDMIFISFPGDEKATGGCLAAGRGFFHINAEGSAEPCPFSPISDTSLKKCTILETLQSPFFNVLNKNGYLLGEHDGGCLLFDKEEELKDLCGCMPDTDLKM